MKKYINKLFYLSSLSLFIALAVGCNDDFLDRKPLDSVTPEQYLNTESDLASYPVGYYLGIFPNHGTGWSTGIGRFDDHTDNQATANPSQVRFVKGYWKVPTNSSLGMERIRAFNYFFEQVLPKYKEGKITGNKGKIDHYIGEVYMLRAAENFNKLTTYGDFPILRNTLADQEKVLVEAAKRAPRNQFARFILSDLDSAILLMENGVFNKTRLTKDAAMLLKARVALYEASFLTYHKGTPRVPGEAGWPGSKASYNSGFSINLDEEINFFLDQAMSASKDLADRIPLSENTHVLNPSEGKPSGWNTYFEMFGDRNMGKYPEILFWREYSKEHSIMHTVSINVKNGANTGLTKGFVNAFVMKNGLPYYAAGSGFLSDTSVMKVKEGRDERLQLFLAGESDISSIELNDKGELGTFGYPSIIGIEETRDVTGYKSRKFLNYIPDETSGSDQISRGGSPVYRVAEAYLTYIEASYMKNKTIDGTASKYWKALRKRAGVDEDFNKTIAATNMQEEAKGDWAAYSGSSLVDATLYNIRRERRCEYVSEGLRFDDLVRWRALDMVKNYVVEGFNLWDEAYKSAAYQPQYDDNGKVTKAGLVSDGTAKANVSSKDLSKYLLPYKKFEANNEVYNGYNWSKANYLAPISFRQMQLASPDGTVENSNLYQNPYWPVEAGGSAIE